MKTLILSLFLVLASTAHSSELGKEVARADEELNQAYQQLVKFYKEHNPGEQDFLTLRSAQRAWITYRDANCSHYVAIDFQGLGDKYNELNCIIEMSDTRTRELLNIAKYTLGEGDECDGC